MRNVDSSFLEYNPETEQFEGERWQWGEAEYTGEAPLGEVYSEAEVMELAAQLLEVVDEAELDHFLGDLIKRAGRAVGKFVSSPTGQALGGILKGAAKQALPVVGQALGGYLGGERGGQLGAQAASAAGRMFGLELEGLSPEDKEFEVAKSFVRFAGDAVKNAAAAPPSVPPRTVAKSAAVQAAQRHAPGLLRNAAAGPAVPGAIAAPSGKTGRWFRRGRNLVIVNC